MAWEFSVLTRMGASLPLHLWLILWLFLGTCSFHDQVTTHFFAFPGGSFQGTLPLVEVCDLSRLLYPSLCFPAALASLMQTLPSVSSETEQALNRDLSN